MFRPKKLGKSAPKQDPRTLKLSHYLQPGLPDPPEEVSNSRGLSGWGMMLNDELGCCTISACGHAIQAWVLSHVRPGIPARPLLYSNETILRYYRAWDGYDPADPNTDQGGVALDVLRQWRKEGLAGRRIVAFVKINPWDALDVRRAIDLFGGLYIGLALPLSAREQEVWTPIPGREGQWNSWGGHAVFLPDYNRQQLTCLTWGEPQRMSWDFFQRYCDEAYAVLSEDWHSPEGFDLPTLEADLRLVTA
jgi:hypothetical protein